ncbi:benzyl alcohol O-benzoyltransferase-like [Oryza brachyantha]|uniref:benzyl alcohol O-benzoyltransferase-like n=1 Tax=Oryza brachyantha TaxID=4533 RepID=UPI001ADCB1D9|nr:benzyl alcohol O-benzoyltransferase-like [Oryza brachyantha]
MATTSSVVRRGAAELVAPAMATPYEFKPLSDIDDQEGLRFYRSGIYLYRRCAARDGVDPAAVVRAALAEALVHYYPLAGRIVEASPGRKLLVECTGEGAVFVEAEAEMEVEELGVVTGPPVPRHEEFLCAAEGAYADGGVVGRPLLYFQVTRMRCGGFVLGIQICHCLADAAGVVQFLTAVSEFTRGVPGAPTVRPVWAREILSARRPPPSVVSRHHPEYEPVPDAGRDKVSPADALVHRPFFFGRREIAALRALVPPALGSRSTRFDLIAAFMWRCRANALQYDAGDAVRVQFVVNARGRGRGRAPLPDGYYGNAFSFAVAESPAGELRRRPFAHALRLVVAAKARAMEEGHLQSVADLMAARGRPRFAVARTYVVSDITRSGIHDVDVGWGKAAYGGPATATLATFHVAGRGGDGEEGVEVPMRLPAPAMERLVVEVARGLAGVDATEACLAARL